MEIEMALQVRRREFVLALAGAAAWPRGGRAQQAAMPVIGFLGSPSAAEWGPFVSAFQRGLKETGYVEGENVAVEYRWADGQYDRLSALATDLVRRQVAVIFAAGSAAPAIAAKGVTAVALGVQVHILNAVTVAEIDTAFASLREQRIGMLAFGADPFFLGRREQFVALAARHAVPAIYFAREFVAAGGLMSYGTSISDAYRRAGIYTGKILKGAKPADLPVEQSTRFEFVINLNAAKTLGLSLPDKLLALADEVIE